MMLNPFYGQRRAAPRLVSPPPQSPLHPTIGSADLAAGPQLCDPSPSRLACLTPVSLSACLTATTVILYLYANLTEKHSAITSKQFDERVRALGDKYLGRV